MRLKMEIVFRRLMCFFGRHHETIRHSELDHPECVWCGRGM
jgi:hypothetical protein